MRILALVGGLIYFVFSFPLIFFAALFFDLMKMLNQSDYSSSAWLFLLAIFPGIGAVFAIKKPLISMYIFTAGLIINLVYYAVSWITLWHEGALHDNALLLLPIFILFWALPYSVLIIVSRLGYKEMKRKLRETGM